MVLLFPCYLGLFVVITYNKYFKYARKPQKMMASYHKNPCKRVVLALFSERLSASENHNTLIYRIFKSHADSDRCFSTFIFFVMCQYKGRILCLYSTSNVFIYAIHKELQAAVSSKAYTNLRQPMVKVVYFLIIRGGILLS